MTTPLADRLASLGMHATSQGLSDLIARATKARWGATELLEHLADEEQKERGRRSLERRLSRSRLGRFKPMADYDWGWPRKIDREAVESALRLDFLEGARNVVIVAPQGLGKTMIAQNIAHQAVLKGHSALFVTASQLLLDLGAQDTSRALDRRLRHYERCGTPGDCLTLFEDGPRIQDDDKRSLALAQAVGPALEGVNAEVRAMLDPTRMLAMISMSITVYMALLLAPVPEPVTKGAALVFSAALWGYLGYEFFDLLRAYAQLYEDAPRASTFAELREIGERFGRVIGPNSVRILVIVGTAAIGETVALASKAPKLPGFAQASERVGASTGLGLLETATGAERLIVSVPEGTIRVVLAPHAVAMAARGVAAGSPAPTRGKLLPNGHRAWGSYGGFKSAMGKAGPGKEWHHIVEQTPGNAKRFGGEALHNTENVIALDKALHDKVSAFYSAIKPRITNSKALTVREWLGTQSYEAQREFGLLAIKNIAGGIR